MGHLLRLPSAGRSDSVTWVHDTYIPGLLKQPRFLWAAHYESFPDEAELVNRVRFSQCRAQNLAVNRELIGGRGAATGSRSWRPASPQIADAP